MATALRCRYRESHYGSSVSLQLDADERIAAFYDLPLDSGAEYSSSPLSLLRGQVVLDSPDGTVELRGEWSYAHSPDRGNFAIRWPISGEHTAVGWWSSVESEQQHPWLWEPEQQDASELTLPTPQCRVALYGQIAAWLFAALTASQLIASVAASAAAAVHLNLVANVVYSLVYACILGLYARSQQHRPSATYIAGVLCYFLGYTGFAALGALVGARPSIAWCEDRLQVGSAALFLAGSLMLVLATFPQLSSSSSHSQRELPSRALARVLLPRHCGVGPSLFWGSLAFLLGSLPFFAAALLLSVLPVAGHQALAWSQGLEVAGNALFLSGRLFFVHASARCRADSS